MIDAIAPINVSVWIMHIRQQLISAVDLNELQMSRHICRVNVLLYLKLDKFRCKNWHLFIHLKAKIKLEIVKAKMWENKLRKSPQGLWKLTREFSGKDSKYELNNLATQFSSPKALAEKLLATLSVNNDFTVLGGRGWRRVEHELHGGGGGRVSSKPCTKQSIGF